MFQFIQRIILGFRFKRAVKKADYLHHLTHRKYMVLSVKQKFVVLSKREIKEALANGVFRHGTDIRDFERRALYVTLQ